MATKRNILIGITGGIAAYKALSLIRLFAKSGYEVKVVATQNALQFVTPLTIETLSNNSLYSDTFALPTERNIDHIALSDWADAVVVAPATANIIGKLASGIADDALSTLLLATKKPLFLAPSMNEKMFQHFSVQANLEYLQQHGIYIIEPDEGFLACQTTGKGRMAEPEAIFDEINNFLTTQYQPPTIKALVTAGPTYEPIDPVRFIGNYSSGLMGFSLAEALAQQGIQVELISGPTQLQTHHPLIRRSDVKTAAEMFEVCSEKVTQCDIIIMAAAVADYTPVETQVEKIKKENNLTNIALKPTTDILKTLSESKKENQFFVGFALETDNELENAKKKLHSKNLDLIVLNSLKDKGAGFNVPTNKVYLMDKSGKVIDIPLQSKEKIAALIVEYMLTVYNQKNQKT